MTREELRERVADLVRFNKDPRAIAEEAIALIRAETLQEAAKAFDDLWSLSIRPSAAAAVVRALIPLGNRPPEDKVCSATQYSDQMVCTKCGLRWDVNDPDPPKCSGEPATGCRTP